MSGALARLARGALRRVAPRAFLALCPRASTDELGRAGEELVARALHRSGARIEARRLRTPWGELDLLARDASGLLAVEVKTARLAPRPRPRGQPAAPLAADRRPGARVDGRGRLRLERIARGLAARRRLPVRAQVWEVLAGPGRATLEVRRVAET